MEYMFLSTSLNTISSLLFFLLVGAKKELCILSYLTFVVIQAENKCLRVWVSNRNPIDPLPK